LAAIVLEEVYRGSTNPPPRAAESLRRDVVKVHAGLASAVDLVRGDESAGAIPSPAAPGVAPVKSAQPAHRQRHSNSKGILPGAPPRDTAGDRSLESRGRQDGGRLTGGDRAESDLSAATEAEAGHDEFDASDDSLDVDVADSHPDEACVEDGHESTLPGVNAATSSARGPSSGPKRSRAAAGLISGALLLAIGGGVGFWWWTT